MKQFAVGVIIALVAGAFIGYQLAPVTDISGYEATIDSLQNQIKSSEELVVDLTGRIVELESELEDKEDELNSIKELVSMVDGGDLPIDWNSTVNDTPLKVVYQLQNYNLDALEETQADIYIIDYSWEGDEETRFTTYEIQRLQNATFDGKVLSYLSIGEAEDYRWYWNEEWVYNEPFWLGPTNPEWEGNYKVRYWDSEWQNITFRYIDKVIESGFDGVYLDIIDAYEYWGPDGESSMDREAAEQDMVDFVIAISEYAKQRNPDFLVYPQNGEALAVHPEYLAAVDGIGREDVWYNDNDVQDDTNTTLWYLSLFTDEGKHVIVIDYPTDPDLVADFCGKAEALGFSSYPGVRDLDEIRLCPEP